jgi:BirA family biotin operon repressor/biotin-[acetyl-CoA-carboxylase] ligase
MDNTIVNTIAGIGLNVNQNEFLSDAPNPVSMSMVSGKRYALDACLGELAGALDNRYFQLLTGEQNKIRMDYISQLYRFNEWSYYHDKTGTFKGRILSVRDDGVLRIESRDSTIKEFSFREVDFIL